MTVAAIPASYGDVSGVTAGADDVRAGKVIVSAAGQQTVGTMPDRGAVSAQLDGLTAARYVIPAGYHSGAGTVTASLACSTRLSSMSMPGNLTVGALVSWKLCATLPNVGSTCGLSSIR